MFRTNRLKHRLRSGQAGAAAWLFAGSPAVAEILGASGFDALIIDQEHSPHGVENTIDQMRSIASAGQSTLLVRVGNIHAHTLKVVLDSGAEGIMVPNVESADEARALLAACRFAPRGSRGAHFTVSRAAGWGSESMDYYSRYDQEMLVVAMIESARGLANAPDILAVDGIDMLFLGPLDLTISLGCMGDYADTRFDAAVAEVAAVARKLGKWAGCTALPPYSAQRLVAMGYSLVTVGSDVTFLQQSAAAGLRSATAARK
ncbi:MAG: 4-hydroxy-2-oxovalerate aldolase [Proteobacteria bacterium]|nr:4-hydroxy-2-oxovalerate aldolase [Pseudomonadota bacterium]MBS0421654.1 4-hydroxy-2-oxovalerate aldolase [Pseudomonadota bacterium]